jgi:hypothetical protein
MKEIIPEHFSRTYAASLIVKNLEQINSYPGPYDSLSFVSHLSHAATIQFKNKDFILSAFSECCYFIFEWFPDCESLLNAINVHQEAEYSLTTAESFFKTELFDILKITEYNFLNIIDIKIYPPIPDIKDNLVSDFLSNVICLREKNRVIGNDDIRELLVYYSFLWLEEGYQKSNRGVLPLQIIDDFLDVLKVAISNNKYYQWDRIDPISEIRKNLLNPCLSPLRKLYFEYLAK